MSNRALVALVLQQLPPPFDTSWYRKATRVVAWPYGHQRVSVSATPIAGRLRRLCRPPKNTPLSA